MEIKQYFKIEMRIIFFGLTKGVLTTILILLRRHKLHTAFSVMF